MPSAREVVAAGWAAGWTLPPPLTVSEWADRHRHLSAVASAAPGQYRTSMTPYVREIADNLSRQSPVRRSIVIGAAQGGKTEVGLNWLGYIVHHNPGPILVVYPTVDVARRVSKQRIGPMIAVTPALRELIREARSRDSGNTTYAKEFPRGMLVLTGANSGSGLRGMPMRDIFFDEVDAYPEEIEREGDPIGIAEFRQANFFRGKTLYTSTPTIKGQSRIEKLFLTTDQRRYFVPCPDCRHMDWMRWDDRMRWDEGDPSTAYLLCLACGSCITEESKPWMLEHGEWRPTAESDDPLTRGYHFNGCYSPFKSWAKCVAEFLAAKDDPSLFRTWWNLVKAETWEERGQGADAETILSRATRYFEIESAAEVPAGVGALLASVDVQGDRLECQVKGYGAAEESWLIAFQQFHGDPARDQVWLDLDEFLRRQWRHESGRMLSLDCVTIDSGGHHTDQVYKFCRARLDRRVFAVRGGAETGKPIVGRPTQNNRYRAKLFTLCVDTAKEVVYARLAIGSPGPGYMHLPEWVDEEYVAQLTAEKGIRKYKPGRGSVRKWIKTRERNEALDLEVYCLAALHILGAQFIRALPERAAQLAMPVAAPVAQKPAPSIDAAVARFRRPQSGWVNRWRG